jgi:hypothetical protein
VLEAIRVRLHAPVRIEHPTMHVVVQALHTTLVTLRFLPLALP